MTPWVIDFTKVFKAPTKENSQLTALDGGSFTLILDLQNSYIHQPSPDSSVQMALSNSADFGAVYASQVKVVPVLTGLE